MATAKIRRYPSGQQHERRTGCDDEALRTHRDLSKISGVELDQEGRVTCIEYMGETASGKLPNVFGCFRKLQGVEFYGHQLPGTIPEFTKCTKLERAYLFKHQPTGSIADFGKNAESYHKVK